MEEEIPGKIVVIYDGCQSESFIDDLSGEDRIIVTSASQYERAKFLNQGQSLFLISFGPMFLTGSVLVRPTEKQPRLLTFTFLIRTRS